jgi:hypothetical protein
MKLPPTTIPPKEFNIQRAILFSTISSILLNTLFIFYQRQYIRTFEIVQNTAWKYYNSLKQPVWMFGMLCFPYIQGIVFFIWRYHYNFPVWALAVILATLWAFWDGSVIGMIENGSLYSFWLIFDIIVAGALWVIASFYLYDRFADYMMRHKKETILLMLPLFIVTQFIIQFRFFVYNRDKTSEKSYFVKIGDAILKVFGIKNYSIKGSKNPIMTNFLAVNNPII